MLGVAAFIGVVFASLAAAATGLLLAWLGIRWKVDQIIAGIVDQLRRGRDHELPVPARAHQEHRAQHAAQRRGGQAADPAATSRSSARSCSTRRRTSTSRSLLMVAFTYMLFKTRWGLRLRASGEKPSAAGTVGIDVISIRYRAMLMAGLMAGIGGSALSLASAGSFQMGMSAGKGFIALAAVIFGAWNPVYAFGAALVFGFADSAQALLSILGVDVPPQLLNSVPYIVTIIVVAGVVGPRARTGRGRPAVRPGLAVSAGYNVEEWGAGPRDPHLPQGRGRASGRRRSGRPSTRSR